MVMNTAAPEIDFLSARLSFSNVELRMMVLSLPQVFGLNVGNIMRIYHYRISLSNVELKKMIGIAQSSSECLQLEDNMEPKLEYLEKRLSLSSAELKMIGIDSSSSAWLHC